MSETEFQGLASTGSGKSEAEVAFELLSKLKGQGVWGERNIASILDMYAECLDAAKGLRAYEGQNRVEAAIQSANRKTAIQKTPPQAPVNTRPPVATQQAAPPIAAAPQRQAVPQQQPVHAQQQAVAQAYKPAG